MNILQTIEDTADILVRRAAKAVVEGDVSAVLLRGLKRRPGTFMQRLFTTLLPDF